jgi:hypothetical protein
MKPPIEYDEAVKKIYDRIEDHKAAHAVWPWQDSTDDKSVLRNVLSLKGKWHLERERDELFEKAVFDRKYYDMLRFALAEKISLSLKLERDEAEWVSKALAGEHKVPPPYKSRDYTVDPGVRQFGLHAFVVECVVVLRRRDLKHRLACEAVAEAFGKHNLDVQSASTVSDIWKEYKPTSYRNQSKNGGS